MHQSNSNGKDDAPDGPPSGLLGVDGSESDPNPSGLGKPLFSDVYLECYKRLLNYFYYRVGRDREIAEDLTQDVFIKAYGAWDGFKPPYTPDTYMSWLYRIAHNTFVSSYVRRRKVRPEEISMEGLALQSSDNESPGRSDMTFDLAALIKGAKLTEKEASAVALVCGARLSYEEAAAALGTTATSVKGLLQRARAKIAEYSAGQGG